MFKLVYYVRRKTPQSDAREMKLAQCRRLVALDNGHMRLTNQNQVFLRASWKFLNGTKKEIN